MTKSSPKQVAIIYPWFAHYRKPIMESLVREFKGEFEFTFIADTRALEPALKVLSPGPMPGVDTVDVAWKEIRNRSLGPFIWQKGVLSAITKTRYDFVIFLGEFRILSTWPAIAIARLRGAKTYLWSHGLYGDEGWLKLRIRLLFYRMAHGMALYGNYSKRLLVEKGFDPNKLFVVYNSLDHAAQVKLRQSLDELDSTPLLETLFPNDPQTPRLIFVGRLTARKQVPLLLDSLRRLLDTGIKVNALIVGDGPERENLETRARQLGIDKQVVFFGECYDEIQLAKMISASCVSVSPGDIGLLAMHSLVYGTPVITHNQWAAHGPEFEAIIDGETGSFFEHGNSESLANAIKKWVLLDDQRRGAVTENCRHVVDSFFTHRFQTRVFGLMLRNLAPTDEVVRLDSPPDPRDHASSQ